MPGWIRRRASHIEPGARVYTDDAKAYQNLSYIYEHESIKHSVGEYVRDQVTTNAIESFWALLKRAHKGTYHKISRKHLHRYVKDFAGRHGIRHLDTWDQMAHVARAMIGKRLPYEKLIA